MFCKYCNKENPRGSTFCDGCGKRIEGNRKIDKKANERGHAPASRSVPSTKAKRKAARKKKRTLVVVLASVILLCVVGVGGFFYWQSLSMDESQEFFYSEEFFFTLGNPENLEYLENGWRFHNNRLHMVAELNAPNTVFEALAREHGAEITSFVRNEWYGDRYTFTFSEVHSIENLQNLVEYFEGLNHINRSMLSKVPDWSPESVSRTSCSNNFNCIPHCNVDCVLPCKPDDSNRCVLNWGLEAINAPIAWHYGRNMHNVGVLVLDDGFYRNHKSIDFSERTLTGWHEPDELRGVTGSHGTHVAGIIGANRNENGNRGVAPNSILFGMPVDHLDIRDRVLILHWFVAIEGAKVVNISLATGGSLNEFAAYRGSERAKEHLGVIAREYEETLYTLLRTGGEFVVVTSSGNQHATFSPSADSTRRFISDNNELGYRRRTQREIDRGVAAPEFGINGIFDPLALIENKEVRDRIIVVGAIDEQNRLAPFSQRGSHMDVSAPGVDIFGPTEVTVETSGIIFWQEREYTSVYGCESGTSQAAPHVSGLAAMLFGIDSTLTGAEVKQIIVETSVGLNNVIDAGAAVRMALGYDLDDEPEVEELEVEEPEDEEPEEREVDTDALYQALLAYHRFLTNPQSMEFYHWATGGGTSWNSETLRYADLIYFYDDEIPKLLIIPPNGNDFWMGQPFAIIGYSGQIDILYRGVAWSDAGRGSSYNLAAISSGEFYLVHNDSVDLMCGAYVPIGQTEITSTYYSLRDGTFTAIATSVTVRDYVADTITTVPDSALDITEIREFLLNVGVSHDIQPLIDCIESRLVAAGFDLTEPIASEYVPIVVEGRLTQAEAEALVWEHFSNRSDLTDLTVEFSQEYILPYDLGQWGATVAGEFGGKEVFLFVWRAYADNGFQYWNSIAVTMDDGVLLHFGTANRVF